MRDLGLRLLLMFPASRCGEDWTVSDNEITHWDVARMGRARPTTEELEVIDVEKKSNSLNAAVQILKTDVPDTWRTSTNTQQRIAWAMKRLFVEAKREIQEGGA